MKAARLLVKGLFVALSIWLLQPAAAAYNEVILKWFNFLVDDSLVNRMTIDAVEALHEEVFGPVVLPRLILFALLVIATWLLLKSLRPAVKAT